MFIGIPGITHPSKTNEFLRSESIHWREEEFKFIFRQIDIMYQGPEHKTIIFVITRNGGQTNIIVFPAVSDRKNKCGPDVAFLRRIKKRFISVQFVINGLKIFS